MELIDFLVTTLFDEQVWGIENLAAIYIANEGYINQESIDYSSQLVRTEKQIRKIIKLQNDKYQKDGLFPPFDIRGTSKHLFKATPTIKILKDSLNPLDENAHTFAERIGY